MASDGKPFDQPHGPPPGTVRPAPPETRSGYAGMVPPGAPCLWHTTFIWT